MLAGLAALVVFAVYLWCRHRGVQPLLQALGVGAVPLHDFRGFFYPMGERLFVQQRPIEGFYYSPTAAVCFAVLARLPYDTAAAVWGAVLISTSVGLGSSVRWVHPSRWLLGFSLTVASYPILHGLRFGQVSAPLCLCVIAAWYAYERGHVRRSAILLAAAVTIEYYFAVFGLLYLARRDRRALIWFTGSCVVGLLLIPTLFIGPIDTLHFYRDVAQSLSDKFGAQISDANSQSVSSAVGRLSKTLQMPWLVAVEPWVRSIISGGLVIGAWRLASRTTSGALANACVVLFCATPFLVATSWPHYFVFVPWCCAVVWRQLAEARPGPWWWTGHVAAGVAVVLVSMPFFDFIGDRHAFVRAGYPLVASLLVLAGSWAAGRAAAGPSTERETAAPRVLAWIGSATVILLALVGRWRLEPYDDAYFFKRFALNFLRDGVFAWNVADGPIHGNTSQLFQGLVAVLTAIDPVHTVALTRIVLALALLSAVIVSSRAVPAKSTPPLVLVMLSPMALVTVWTGMETAIVFLLEAAFLLSVLRSRKGVPWGAVGLAILLYTARPDTALLATLTFCVAFWHRGWRAVALPMGLVAVGISGFLLLCHLYYGAALPVSFYLKSGQSLLYDEHFVALSMVSKREHLTFVGCMLAPVSFMLAVGRRFDRAVLTCVLPAVAFVTYHAATTVEVMGMHGRFYAPIIPFLAVAVALSYSAYQARARSWAVIGFAVSFAVFVVVAYTYQWIPTARGWPIGRTEPAIYMGYVVAACVVLAAGVLVRPQASAWAWGALAFGVLFAYRARALEWPKDRAYLDRYQRHVTSYRGMPRLLACLGDEAHIYHSEIGVVGLAFSRGTVTDLGGLMSPELTLGDTTFEQLCARDRPDAIFLPHRNYRTLNRTIREGRCIQDYELVHEDSSSPLYVRRDLVPNYHCDLSQ